MTKIVIGIAGRIATGKSSFVRSVASRINADVVSFGDYVREQALATGLDPDSRETLQSLGEQLKRDLGDEEFVRQVINQASGARHVVVDGVRHVEVATTIERLVLPRRFYLIYLEVDEEVRRMRAEQSRPEDAARLTQLASHSTERQVHDGSLLSRAALVLDAAGPIEKLVDEAADFLEILTETSRG